MKDNTKKEEPGLQEISFAVFGAKNSGKTTMLAAYYGSQQTDAFCREHGYYFSADSTTDGNELLAKFHRLEDGIFPPSSPDLHEYVFSFFVDGLAEPSFRVRWMDYPGGWWEREPRDMAEKADRDTALHRLLNCHACIFLIDGEKYLSEGMTYVRTSLDQFRNEGRKIQQAFSELNESSDWPQNWIIGLSKADLLSPKITAEDISKDILKGASDSISGLSKILNDESLGHKVLLLASVKTKRNKIVDPFNHIGFNVLAPAVLLANIQQVRDRMPEGKGMDVAKRVTFGVRKIFSFIDKLDDFLPKKYQVISILLDALQIDDILDKQTEYFRKRQEKAVRKKQILEAGIEALKAQLASEEARRVYHQPFKSHSQVDE